MQYVYPCVLTPEDEGGFFVSFPDVPEALTGGDDRAEALAMAEDALATALGMYVKEREDIPVPSIAVAGQALVAVPTIVAAKLALYTRHAPTGHLQGGLGPNAWALAKAQCASCAIRTTAPISALWKMPCGPWDVAWCSGDRAIQGLTPPRLLDDPAALSPRGM